MSEKRRPTRACRVRSSQAPASGTSTEVNRARTQASQVPSFPQELQPSSVDPDELRKLRSMWELASVISFFDTFWPVLKLEKRFTAQELELALLHPSVLLVDVHIGLLKGLSPPMRTSLNRETWAAVLYKKLKDRWAMVSEAPFPLAGSHGKEAEVYKEFDVASRLNILKALCECRLDQDDVRIFMEASGKKDASAFRKERCGTDSHGTTYWYEDGPVSGYRLYKEYREIRKLTEKDARGTAALLPPAGEWETMASSLDEFRAVAGNLSNSRNRQELALSKRLLSDTIPVLEELQKKKERILKRQQRQAILLDNSLSQANGHTPGRALRDRKQVTYTFDEFERSITEAIKYTRKQPEPTPKSNGGAPTANGHVKVTRSKHKEAVRQRNARLEAEHDYSDGRSSGSDNHEPLDGAGPVPSEDAENDSPPSARRRKRSQSNVRKQYAYDEDEEDIYSDDEIEGEAIYDEEFVRRRKRRKGYTSSQEQEDDEATGEQQGTDSDSYKGEEDEDDDDDDDEEEAEPVQRWRSRSRPLRRVRQSKLLAVKAGLRRSQRNKRRRVNYRAGESDVEEEQEEEEEEDEPPPVRRRRRQKEAPSGSSSIEDRDSESSGRDHRQEEEKDEEEQEEEPGSTRGDDGEGGEEEQEEEEVEQGEGSPAVAEERRERRFLDLNECAPSESPRDQRSALEGTESDEATMLLF